MWNEGGRERERDGDWMHHYIAQSNTQPCLFQQDKLYTVLKKRDFF